MLLFFLNMNTWVICIVRLFCTVVSFVLCTYFHPHPKYRWTERQINRQKDFSYQNKSWSECKQDVRKIEWQADRQTERQTDRRTDRKTDRKTKRLFSLVIKTKVFQNVNRMSKIQSDRQEDIQFARQTDRVTERQNDSMADSRAAKDPAIFGYKQRLLSLDMKTKDVQHVASEWMQDLQNIPGSPIKLLASCKCRK